MDQARKTQLDDLVIGFLQAGKEGGKEILPKILEIIQGPVFSFLVAMEIPEADAPDVAAKFYRDLFDKKIWRYKPQPPATFWSWLCAVLVNITKDWHRAHADNPETDLAASDMQSLRNWQRKSATGSSVRLSDLDAYPGGELPVTPSPEMLGVLQAFERAFDSLTEAEQDLLRLREVEGLAYERIAEILHPGYSLEADHSPQSHDRLIGKLKTRFSRAKDKIREAMEADARVPRSFFEVNSKGDGLNGKRLRGSEGLPRTGS